MFNEFTRTFYDDNEEQLYKITSEKPLRFINNTQTTYKGNYSENPLDINKSNNLRTKPTRLNEFYRTLQYQSLNPYENLKYKTISEENELIIDKDINVKYRYETDDTYREQSFFNVQNHIDNDLRPQSSRNVYKNLVVCSK